jgi:hypothetical protein
VLALSSLAREGRFRACEYPSAFLNTGLGIGDPERSTEPGDLDDEREPNVRDDGARMGRPERRRVGVGEAGTSLLTVKACRPRAGHKGCKTGDGSAAGDGVNVRLWVKRNLRAWPRGVDIDSLVAGILFFEAGAFAGEIERLRVVQGAICWPIKSKPCFGCRG